MRALGLGVMVVTACAGPATRVPVAAGPVPPAPVADRAPTVANRPMFVTPPPALGGERIAMALHKFLSRVGSERDTYRALPDGGVEAKALFAYNDRTTLVPLVATVTIGADGRLLHFAQWGRTSRFTLIDVRVDARPDGGYDVVRDGVSTRAAPAGPVVLASGYAPMLLQDLMLRAWDQQGRPEKVAALPEGEVTIHARGKETYDVAGAKVTLEHVLVEGLVWGVEDAWLDEHGQLAAVITRDAEFDHHEAAVGELVSLLPELAKASGTDGVQRLAARLHPRGGIIALVGGTVIDGTGRAPIADAVVLVDGDRITAVGPRQTVAVPSSATTIDVTGAAILAGLWDMHAHVEQVEQGAAYLGAGITTVRDLGNVMPFITGMRDTIAAGRGLGPRILVDGLVDGSGDGALGTIRITAATDIKPVIDQLRKDGCVEVKIYSSIAPALVKPIAAYAHAHGMRVVGHVPRGMTSQQAIDAGYDSISHVNFLWDAYPEITAAAPAAYFQAYAARDLAAPALTHLIASLVAHHVVIDDTLALDESGFFTAADFARREPGVATLPRELLATLSDIPASFAADAGAAFAKELALVRLLHARGVTLVAGTDISIPAHSLLRELELYVLAGFTPLEAIQASTIVPARYMHLDKELGTVEVGKRADLVVVSGNPLTAIGDIRKTKLVIARGQVYESAALWTLAGFH